jgi:hypothetical protein
MYGFLVSSFIDDKCLVILWVFDDLFSWVKGAVSRFVDLYGCVFQVYGMLEVLFHFV